MPVAHALQDMAAAVVGQSIVASTATVAGADRIIYPDANCTLDKNYVQEQHVLWPIYVSMVALCGATLVTRLLAARSAALPFRFTHVGFLLVVTGIAGVRIIDFHAQRCGQDELVQSGEGMWLWNFIGSVPMLASFTLFSLLIYHVGIVLRAIHLTYEMALRGNSSAGPGPIASLPPADAYTPNMRGSGASLLTASAMEARLDEHRSLWARPSCVPQCNYWFVLCGRPQSSLGFGLTVLNAVMWSLSISAFVLDMLRGSNATFDIFCYLLLVPAIVAGVAISICFMFSAGTLLFRLRDLLKIMGQAAPEGRRSVVSRGLISTDRATAHTVERCQLPLVHDGSILPSGLPHRPSWVPSCSTQAEEVEADVDPAAKGVVECGRKSSPTTICWNNSKKAQCADCPDVHGDCPAASHTVTFASMQPLVSCSAGVSQMGGSSSSAAIADALPKTRLPNAIVASPQCTRTSAVAAGSNSVADGDVETGGYVHTKKQSAESGNLTDMRFRSSEAVGVIGSTAETGQVKSAVQTLASSSMPARHPADSAASSIYSSDASPMRALSPRRTSWSGSLCDRHGSKGSMVITRTSSIPAGFALSTDTLVSMHTLGDPFRRELPLVEPVLSGLRRMLTVIATCVISFLFRACSICYVFVLNERKWPQGFFVPYMCISEVLPYCMLLLLYLLPGIQALCFSNRCLAGAPPQASVLESAMPSHPPG